MGEDDSQPKSCDFPSENKSFCLPWVGHISLNTVLSGDPWPCVLDSGHPASCLFLLGSWTTPPRLFYSFGLRTWTLPYSPVSKMTKPHLANQHIPCSWLLWLVQGWSYNLSWTSEDLSWSSGCCCGKLSAEWLETTLGTGLLTEFVTRIFRIVSFLSVAVNLHCLLDSDTDTFRYVCMVFPEMSVLYRLWLINRVLPWWSHNMLALLGGGKKWEEGQVGGSKLIKVIS